MDWLEGTGLFGQIYSTASLYDVDGDEDLEIFFGTVNAPTNVGKFIGLHHNGTPIENWPPSYPSNYIFSSPAIGDIDNDGDVEIIFGSAGTLHGGSWTKGAVFAFHHNGTIVDGWPMWNIPSLVRASPALVDLNGDGYLEIVISDSVYYIYAFNHRGTFGSSWFQEVASGWASATIADVDGDSEPEIAIGNQDGNLFVFNSNGSLLDDFPIITGSNFQIRSTPAFADINNDGQVEIVFETDNY